MKRGHRRGISVGSGMIEKADHRQRRLLRARRERPRSRTAEQRDEVAPFHSITSSAPASSVRGTSRNTIPAFSNGPAEMPRACLPAIGSPALDILDRNGGLVVSAIIAVLIALMVPEVQPVR